MKSNLIKGGLAIGAVLVLAGSLHAQQHGGGPGTGSLPRIDTSKVVKVQGEVVGFLAGYGQGMPELTLRQADGTESAFVLGPFYYLQAQGFAAQAGDIAEVTGWACSTCEHSVAVASVKNLTRGLTLILRNADGTPVWISGQGGVMRRHLGAGTGAGSAGGQGVGSGPGAGAVQRHGRHLCDGDGPDLTKVATYTGSVKSFTGGAGEGFPTLVLATASAEVSIMMSPYRALFQAGYTLTVGTQVEVKAAPVTVDGSEHWVALTLTDLGTGLLIVLRDPETGLPLMGHGCGH